MDEEVIITIIIKSPSQLIDDQTVDCNRNWSVGRLKEHLSQVYPTKPRVVDQKLIHGGHLLKDTAMIKDILRRYEIQNNLTFHLICLRKDDQNQRPNTPTGNTTPGPSGTTASRNRIGYHTSYTTHPFFRPSSLNTVGYPSMGWFMRYDMTGDQTQNFQQLQNLYYRYLEDYMHVYRYRTELYNTERTNLNNEQRVNNEGQLPEGEREPFDLNIRDIPEEVVGEVDDENEAHDWLDRLYSLAKIMTLVMLIYFYSTPTRALSVFFLSFLVYANHVGLFRNILNALNEDNNVNNNNNNLRNNNNNVRNNNNEGNNAEEDILTEDGEDDDDSDNEENGIAQEETPVVVEPRLTFMGYVRLVVRSFLLSLIPERQNNV